MLDYIYQKNPSMSGPAQFAPVLCQGQLHIYLDMDMYFYVVGMHKHIFRGVYLYIHIFFLTESLSTPPQPVSSLCDRGASSGKLSPKAARGCHTPIRRRGHATSSSLGTVLSALPVPVSLYSLSTYCIPDTVLGTWDTKDQNSCPQGLLAVQMDRFHCAPLLSGAELGTA